VDPVDTGERFIVIGITIVGGAAAVGVSLFGFGIGLGLTFLGLATAHPAKFPDAVEKASGRRPHLPQRLSHLLNAKERFTILPNSATAVRDFVLSIKKA
jgi:threonine synthase